MNSVKQTVNNIKQKSNQSKTIETTITKPFKKNSNTILTHFKTQKKTKRTLQKHYTTNWKPLETIRSPLEPLKKN